MPLHTWKKEYKFKLVSKLIQNALAHMEKRLEFLENFKIRIGEVFTELIGDLNEFNNKTND